MDNLRILVVEDDKLAQKVMAKHLGAHSVEFAADVDTAVRKLAAGDYDLCFIDLRLDGNEECAGLKVIPLAVKKGIYSVVMSGHDSEEMVGKAYELGCNDFYAKGNEEANVGEVIAKYLKKRAGFDTEHIFTNQFILNDALFRQTS